MKTLQPALAGVFALSLMVSCDATRPTEATPSSTTSGETEQPTLDKVAIDELLASRMWEADFSMITLAPRLNINGEDTVDSGVSPPHYTFFPTNVGDMRFTAYHKAPLSVSHNDGSVRMTEVTLPFGVRVTFRWKTADSKLFITYSDIVFEANAPLLDGRPGLGFYQNEMGRPPESASIEFDKLQSAFKSSVSSLGKSGFVRDHTEVLTVQSYKPQQIKIDRRGAGPGTLTAIEDAPMP